MPINYSEYPANWKTEIVPRIKARAGDKCEWCGAPNHTIIRIRRSCAGVPEVVEGMAAESAWIDGDKLTYIILTTAHLGVAKTDGTLGDKHDKYAVREENLACLCQRCHLNFDRDDHIKHRRENRDVRLGILRMDLG